MHVYVLFYVLSVWMVFLIVCKWLACILDVALCCISALHAWAVARTDILPHASSSRLGENSRSSPWFCSSISLRRPTLVMSNASSRSGEDGSPKRALVEINCFLCSRPRPSEEFSFWAKNYLVSPRWEGPA